MTEFIVRILTDGIEIVTREQLHAGDAVIVITRTEELAGHPRSARCDRYILVDGKLPAPDGKYRASAAQAVY